MLASAATKTSAFYEICKKSYQVSEADLGLLQHPRWSTLW